MICQRRKLNGFIILSVLFLQIRILCSIITRYASSNHEKTHYVIVFLITGPFTEDILKFDSVTTTGVNNKINPG